jgi:tRNA pseudouridine55 synthase
MDGILIVDKPQGMTSHDVVDFIRRRFNIKKVGHAGTLDPMATGVLVMLVGKATKLSGELMAHDKEYDAEMTLGQSSDTGDAWGKVEVTDPDISFTRPEIEKAFREFIGEIDQTPPMYSAVKHNGRKLYELARKGITVDVKPRKIIIKSLNIKSIALPQVEFSVTCSKGTYIRQLCIDIGAKLGSSALLSKLRRTRSGRFGIGEAISMSELDRLSKMELEKRLTSVILSPADLSAEAKGESTLAKAEGGAKDLKTDSSAFGLRMTPIDDFNKGLNL